MEDIRLTDEQERLLEKVIKLLEPFYEGDPKQERQSTVCYFTDENGDELGKEYDTCTCDDCIEASIKNIKETFGDEMPIETHFTLTGNDNEDIPRCSICGKPFEEGLTWIEHELEHFEQNKPTYSDMVEDSSIPYELVAIFNSVPSCDNRIDGYCKSQLAQGNEGPNLEVLKRQQHLIDRVVYYAVYIIYVIEKK
jgi:hypothetical protein